MHTAVSFYELPYFRDGCANNFYLSLKIAESANNKRSSLQDLAAAIQPV